MTRVLFYLVFLLVPFLSCKAAPSNSVKGGSYNTRIKEITNHFIVLTNHSVWRILNLRDSNPLRRGHSVMILVNNNDYVVLAKCNNPAKFVECSLDYIQGEGEDSLRVNRIGRFLHLTDGSRWNIPHKVSDLTHWNPGDEVVVMPTPDKRMFQIINADLPYREPGSVDYVIAEYK